MKYDWIMGWHTYMRAIYLPRDYIQAVPCSCRPSSPTNSYTWTGCSACGWSTPRVPSICSVPVPLHQYGYVHWTPFHDLDPPYNHGLPAPGHAQDASLVMVERTHGRTLVALRRPLVSCEAPADRPVLNGTRQTVIFAYGATPGLAYHGPAHRGQFEVVLVPDAAQQQQQAASPSSIPADAKVRG